MGRPATFGWFAGLACITMLVGSAASCSASHGGHTASASTTSTSTSTTVPAATSSYSDPYTWTRSGSAALSVGGGPTTTLASVAGPSGPDGWVIAGTRTGSTGASTATVWSSPTGAEWTATPLTTSGIPSRAEGVTASGDRTVVVGTTGSGPTEQAAIWLATGRGPFLPEVVSDTPAGSALYEVSAGAFGLFALGAVDGKATLWSSTNGQQWTESVSATRAFASTTDAAVDTVLAEGDAVFAGGSIAVGGGTDAAVWESTDGVNWKYLQSDQPAVPGNNDSVIESLAPLGSGVVAAGGARISGQWDPVSWISPDGTSWSLASMSFPMAARPHPSADGSMVHAVSAIARPAGGPTLVAVGGNASDQRLWTSVDGLHWAEQMLPAPAADSSSWSATTVAESGSGVSATTVVADGDPGDPHVLVRSAGAWSEPSSNPATFGPLQAVATPISLSAGAGIAGRGSLILSVEIVRPSQSIGGPGADTEARFISSDGSTWVVAGPGGNPSSRGPAGPPGSTALIRFEGRWAAVGQIQTEVAVSSPTTSTGSSSPNQVNTVVKRAASWTSTDGVHWQSAGTMDTKVYALDQQPRALCVATAPATLVAVGTAQTSAGGTTAVAWVSTDGIHWTDGSVQSAGSDGGQAELVGCQATPDGLVAYGAAAGPGSTGGLTVPAVWTSESGSSWGRDSSPAFADTDPADAAAAGLTAAMPATPAATVPSDGITGFLQAGFAQIAVSAGGTGGQQPLDGDPPWAPPGSSSEGGLWLSVDGGSNWRAVDTFESPWTGVEQAQVDTAGFIDDTPVIAGEVDGRLAVWTGTLTGPATSATTTALSPGQ